MIELKGKYGTAKIFTDNVDETSIAQIINLLNQPYVKGSKVRMMPDVHAGAGCTIGTTMTVSDKICPNLIGVDIGCGVNITKLKRTDIDVEKLDKVIRKHIPSGQNIHSTYEKSRVTEDITDLLKKLYCKNNINLDRALCSIGTLGGGNHFIEVNKDKSNNIYLVIHSGSRHLGLEVAKYYQNEAYNQLTKYNKTDIKKIITDLKSQGREKEIQNILVTLKDKECSIPKDLAYLENELLKQYLHDIEIIQKFADVNRKTIAQIIVNEMGLDIIEQFTTIHNYIDVKNMILRKGSVSAQDGEKLIIPINMRDGSLICIGKGNSDWNYSAPHGAGRLFSRGQAKEKFNLEEFKESMSGIYTTSVNNSTIDECPMVYKSMSEIMENIKPTVNIIDIIKPIYNFKA